MRLSSWNDIHQDRSTLPFAHHARTGQEVRLLNPSPRVALEIPRINDDAPIKQIRHLVLLHKC